MQQGRRGETSGGRARAGGMVGEVPLAPRVEDKEEAREKSRVPPLWRNNSEGSLARARSAHGSSVTPSTGTASVTHSFAKGQPIHSSKFTHYPLPPKKRFPWASPSSLGRCSSSRAARSPHAPLVGREPWPGHHESTRLGLGRLRSIAAELSTSKIYWHALLLLVAAASERI